MCGRTSSLKQRHDQPEPPSVDAQAQPKPVRAPQDTVIVVVSDDRTTELRDPTLPGRGAVGIVVKDRWIPSKSGLAPYAAPAAGVTAYRAEQEQRRATCGVPALVYEPAVVSFLLSNELGIASVTWKRSMYPANRTFYALRIL